MKLSRFQAFFLFLFFALHSFTGRAQTWELVGGQLSNATHTRHVYCLTSDTVNNLLYAGGGFVTLSAASDTVHNIAVWNGASWKPVGKGANDSVYAITLYNGGIYVAGKFTSIGGTSAARIASLTGTSFSALGSGIGNTSKDFIHAMTVFNGELYMAGNFSVANGIPVSNIVKWNGSIWTDVGGGTNGAIYSLTVYNGKLYAGGVFSQAGSSATNNIASWDGSTWSKLGTGANNAVYALETYGSYLFVGGKFTILGGNTANNIGTWNGIIWSASGNGMNNTVLSLKTIGPTLYIGGAFTNYGNFVTSLTGNSWSSMESGMDYFVRCFANYGGKIHAGGDFDIAGGNPTGPTARWNTLAPHSAFTVTSSSFCHGDCVQFTDHSVNSPTTWLWVFPGGTPATSNLQNPGTVCYPTPGAYNVYLSTTNSSGADLQTNLALMLVHPYIQLPVAYGLCKGNGVTMTARDGGTYSWSPSTNLTCTTCASPVANPTTNQKYFVTVVDSTSCSWTDSTLVVVDPLPTPTLSYTDTAVCKGTRIQLKAGGGTAYNWTPVSGLSSTNISNPFATQVNSGYVKVKVSKSYSSPSVTCAAYDSVFIRVKPLPTLNQMPEEHICPGGNVQLQVNGGAQWAWHPSAGLSDTTLSNPVCTPSLSTIYYVTATDTNACKASDSVRVSIGCELVFYSGFGPGLNGGKDYWVIDGIENSPINEVSIFNEWGSLVWDGKNYDNDQVSWKGSNQSGQPLVAGTYYYFAKTADKTYKGWVQLFH